MRRACPLGARTGLMHCCKNTGCNAPIARGRVDELGWRAAGQAPCVVRGGMHSAIASVASALDPRGYFVGCTGRETDRAQPAEATDLSDSIRAPLTMGLFVPDVA